MKLHWPAVIGVLTTVGGLISSPEVAHLLPAKWSAAAIAVGAAIQALTKAIHHDGEPK